MLENDPYQEHNWEKFRGCCIMQTQWTLAKRRESVTYKFGDRVERVNRVNKRESRNRNLRVTRFMVMHWGRKRRQKTIPMLAWCKLYAHSWGN